MHRILVIRLRRLGDVLTSTPALRALRSAHPTARIDVLVSEGFQHALHGNPHIDELIVMRPGLSAWLELRSRCRRQPYDMVLDLQGSPRSTWCVLATGARTRVGWKKTWLRDVVYNVRVDVRDPEYAAQKKLRMIAATGARVNGDVDLELAIEEADRVFAWGRLRRSGITTARPILAVSAVARVACKQWSAKKYAELADRAIGAGMQVVLTYGPAERHQVVDVVRSMRFGDVPCLFGDTTLPRIAALYEHCDLWIGNDGAAKHVAVAAGCPTVMVVGPYSAARPRDLARQEWVTADLARVSVDDVWHASHRLLSVRARNA